MSDEIKKFQEERKERIRKQGENEVLNDLSTRFMEESMRVEYSYNFSWMGRPIIQYPQDIVAMQEVIWKVQPDLIIETGIAHGGSLILYASLMELIGHGEIVGVDIDIRSHNREEIENHKMFKRIHLIEGGATDPDIIEQVRKMAEGKKKVMVVLDSNHTHQHVYDELKLYNEFVTKDSYLVVFDTVVEYLPKGFFTNRPWDVGDNPQTAVDAFLKENDAFEIDEEIHQKLQLTVAKRGYLKRTK
ncbi:cephalosporin hydroxylase family protein [bacterium SCSIO 12741]|nr:cephalosporin hydroxylase family protein [bacterium SCSIO 12741]